MRMKLMGSNPQQTQMARMSMKSGANAAYYMR